MCSSRIVALSVLTLLASPRHGLTLIAEHTEDQTLVLRNPSLPFWSTQGPGEFRVRLETTKGDVILSVTRAWAPNGADRFYHLVKAGFYDDSRFFRVLSGRFAQFGIPGNPAIARIWRTRSFPDDPVKAHNVR